AHHDPGRTGRIHGERLAQQRQHAAVEPGGGLDHVRQVPLALALSVRPDLATLVVEVVEPLPAVLLVLAQVIVRAVRDAFQFAEARRGDREAVVDVARARAVARVVRELVALVLAQAEVLAREPDPLPPRQALLAPELVPRARVVGMAEELDLHLLELAAAEREVARRHLVAERLAGLRDAERDPDARRVDDVAEVREDALRGLRAQPDLVLLVEHRAGVGVEHQVELARLGEVAATVGARGDERTAQCGPGRHPVQQRAPRAGRTARDRRGVRALGGEAAHEPRSGRALAALLARPAFQRGGRRRTERGVHPPLWRAGFRDQRLPPRRLLQRSGHVVRAEQLLALPAGAHRVGAPADVTARDPHLRVLDDARVERDDADRLPVGAVRAAAGDEHDVLPPGVAQVLLQLGAERAVVPE